LVLKTDLNHEPETIKLYSSILQSSKQHDETLQVKVHIWST
jgi:hypothetical protein